VHGAVDEQGGRAARLTRRDTALDVPPHALEDAGAGAGGIEVRYRLILQPVALGDGLPLFKDLTAPLRLELVDAQTYNTGAALHVYRPAPAAA
jgi:hypothetical protein